MVMEYVPPGRDSKTAFSNLSKYWHMVADKNDENIKIDSLPLSRRNLHLKDKES